MRKINCYVWAVVLLIIMNMSVHKGVEFQSLGQGMTDTLSPQIQLQTHIDKIWYELSALDTLVNEDKDASELEARLFEVSRQANTLQASMDKRQIARHKGLWEKKSRVARDLAVHIIEKNQTKRIEAIRDAAFENMRAFVDRRVAQGKMEQDKGAVKLKTAIRFINEWLDPSNDIPNHIRAGIIRGMLEVRDADLLFAFGEGWRKFGTAGIRNPAVASEYAVMEYELMEFRENVHAPILTGPNMINTVTLLQQEAAVVRLLNYLQTNIDNPDLHFSAEFKKFIKQSKVTIAYDSRLNGEYFAKMLATAFLKDGIEVDLFDNAAGMPDLVYAASERISVFGFLISASHSEANFNGFKVVFGHLKSQLDSAGKDMIMKERAQVTYQSMHRDLAKKKIGEFNKILQEHNKTLTWLGSAQKREGYKYCGAKHEDFYTGYHEHVKKRSPLAQLSKSMQIAIGERKRALKVLYTANYGVGAVPASNFPGFLKEKGGYENVEIVEAQTLVMDGLFPGHYMPDPGVVSGWIVNFMDYLLQTAGKDLSNLEYAIHQMNTNEVGVGTDPDIDRAGMTLSLPKGIVGNIKQSLLKAVSLHIQQHSLDDRRDEILSQLEEKLNDKLLLTANDAWAFMAYYQLQLLYENNLLSQEHTYFIEESHVTTPALERIAQIFRDKGYKIHVIQTYVGFTELAKKSRDLFSIAELCCKFWQEYSDEFGDDWQQRVSALVNDLSVAYQQLRTNVPEGSNQVSEIETLIQGLKSIKNKKGIAEIMPLVIALSNMNILYGVEESNGYGEFGRFDPQKGEIVDSHICEKDGSLAAFKFLELIAWGKEQDNTGFDMYMGMMEELGHVSTDNRFLPHPGLTGNDQKEAEMQAYEKCFAYRIQQLLDHGETVTLFGGKYTVEQVEVYRDGKYDDIYRGFPEEGVRLYLTTKKGSSAIVTIRPSGTGDTIRCYSWIMGKKPQLVDPSTHPEQLDRRAQLEAYRQEINRELAVLAQDFFGGEDLQKKGNNPQGYFDVPREEFTGLMAAINEAGQTRYNEVFAKVVDNWGLTEQEQQVIDIAGKLAFATRKGSKPESWILKKNFEVMEQFLSKATSVSEAVLKAWQVSLSYYYAVLVAPAIQSQVSDVWKRLGQGPLQELRKTMREGAVLQTQV